MKRINKSKAFGGSQEVFCHFSEQLKCEMNFAIYIPEQAKNKKLSNKQKQENKNT